jgi:hypothetical protein
MIHAEVSDKILEKIQKLFALAGSPNENEAAVAAQKAQELLTLHKLELADIEGHFSKREKSDEVIEDTLSMKVSKWQPWQWQVLLAGGVARACYCRLIFIGGKSITFIGAREDAQVAKELFLWLKDQIYRLGIEESNLNAWRMHPLKFRPNFWVGCSRRVSDLLFWKREDMERENAKVTTLVKMSDALNDEYVKRVYEKLRMVNLGQTSSRWAANKGYEAGDKVDLNVKKRLGE